MNRVEMRSGFNVGATEKLRALKKEGNERAGVLLRSYMHIGLPLPRNRENPHPEGTDEWATWDRLYKDGEEWAIQKTRGK